MQSDNDVKSYELDALDRYYIEFFCCNKVEKISRSYPLFSFVFFLFVTSHSCAVTPREPRFASRSDTFRVCLILNFLEQ